MENVDTGCRRRAVTANETVRKERDRHVETVFDAVIDGDQIILLIVSTRRKVSPSPLSQVSVTGWFGASTIELALHRLSAVGIGCSPPADAQPNSVK